MKMKYALAKKSNGLDEALGKSNKQKPKKEFKKRQVKVKIKGIRNYL